MSASASLRPDCSIAEASGTCCANTSLACFLIIGINKALATDLIAEPVGLEFACASGGFPASTDVNKDNSVHVVRCDQPTIDRHASAQTTRLAIISRDGFDNCPEGRAARSLRSTKNVADLLESASIGKSWGCR